MLFLNCEFLFAFSVQYKEVKKISNEDLHVENFILILMCTFHMVTRQTST